MRKLLLLACIALTLGVKGQCIPNSITNITPDSAWTGDTVKFVFQYQWGTGYFSNNNDTVVFNIQSADGSFGQQLFKICGNKLPTYGCGCGGTDTLKFIMPNASQVDSTLYHARLSVIDNENKITAYMDFIGRRLVLGVNEITGINYRVIKEVRYYLVTGQLYGTYSHKQTTLPSIPLIEQVIYTDNSTSSRSLFHLN
jgi:hypothetical protein